MWCRPQQLRCLIFFFFFCGINYTANSIRIRRIMNVLSHMNPIIIIHRVLLNHWKSMIRYILSFQDSSGTRHKKMTIYYVLLITMYTWTIIITRQHRIAAEFVHSIKHSINFFFFFWIYINIHIDIFGIISRIGIYNIGWTEICCIQNLTW